MMLNDDFRTLLTHQTVFVTGATGFLGGALTKALSEMGVRVRALARRPERAGFIRDLPHVEVVEGDINDRARLIELVEGCGVIFHVAAALNGAYETAYRVNVDGTANIAHAAHASGARIVHISTIAVYGYRNTGDVTEDTPPAPAPENYAITKLEAERTLQKLAEQFNIPYTIVRPGMIYGPRSGAWTAGMFRLARRKPVLFIGDGSGSTYAVHVDDVVGLTILCAVHPEAVGEIFHATPDPSPTWREFLGAYSRLAGHDRWLGIPPVLLQPVAWLGGKFGSPSGPLRALPELLPFSQRTITYKMTKARQRLGWENQIDLQSGIEGTAGWLREKGLL